MTAFWIVVAVILGGIGLAGFWVAVEQNTKRLDSSIRRATHLLAFGDRENARKEMQGAYHRLLGNDTRTLYAVLDGLDPVQRKIVDYLLVEDE